jgi:putative transposase
MARIARVVAAGEPHHVTQRGNRRQPVFLREGDEQAYLRLLREMGAEHGLQVLGDCLMTNHVHLVVVPEREDSLAQAVGWTHFRYTRLVNMRENWRGYLWQGRFHSCVMDSAHTLRALRYVELNPVRAGLVERPEEWPWSSARAHLDRRRSDPVLAPRPWLTEELDWRAFLQEDIALQELAQMRRHLRSGRPYGDESFVERLERLLSRDDLKRARTGPKGPWKHKEAGGE